MRVRVGVRCWVRGGVRVGMRCGVKGGVRVAALSTSLYDSAHVHTDVVSCTCT